MATGGTYAGQGEDYCERRAHRDREHTAARYQQALARLGYQVTLTPIDTGPPPGPAATPPPDQAA